MIESRDNQINTPIVSSEEAKDETNLVGKRIRRLAAFCFLSFLLTVGAILLKSSPKTAAVVIPEIPIFQVAGVKELGEWSLQEAKAKVVDCARDDLGVLNLTVGVTGFLPVNTGEVMEGEVNSTRTDTNHELVSDPIPVDEKDMNRQKDMFAFLARVPLIAENAKKLVAIDGELEVSGEGRLRKVDLGMDGFFRGARGKVRDARINKLSEKEFSLRLNSYDLGEKRLIRKIFIVDKEGKETDLPIIDKTMISTEALEIRIDVNKDIMSGKLFAYVADGTTSTMLPFSVSANIGDACLHK